MHRTTRNLLCSIVVLFQCAYSFGLVDRLVGGSQAKASDYPSVFIWTTEGETITEEYCTAAKVGREWILTAAHCALGTAPNGYGPWEQLSAMQPGKRIRASFSRILSESPRQFFLEIKSVQLPPALESCLKQKQDNASAVCMKGRVPEPDVILIQVEPGNTLFANAPILPLDREPLRDEDKILLLGYGAESDDDWRPPRLKSHRAEVASETEMQKALIGTMAETDGKPNWTRFFGSVGPLFTAGTSCLGSGDSGGPVLKAKPWRIVGINSDGYCPKEKPGCERASNSIFARVDDGDANRVGSWIQSTIK